MDRTLRILPQNLPFFALAGATTGALGLAYGVASSPLLAAGALVGGLALGGTVAFPLIAVAVMLALGPVDISFLSGGARQLLPAVGGLDMSGIRLVALCAGLGLVVVTRKELLAALTSREARWYTLFLAWGTVTLAFSPAPLEGLRLLLKIAYPLLVFLVVAAPERTPADVERLGDWTLWGATAILLVNPIFVANGGYAVESGEIVRVMGLGSHHNPFSFYLLALLLMALARFRSRGQRRYLLLAGVAVIWMGLTLARITVLASAVALAVVAVYAAVIDRNRRVLVTIGAIGLLAGSLVARGVLLRTFGYLPGPGQLLALLGDPVGLYHAMNWQGREILWAVLWISFRADPFGGSGLGASDAILQAAHLERAAHNDYLRLAVDVGVIGLSLYLLAISAWARAVSRAIRSGAPGVHEFAMPAIASIAAWAVIAVTDNAFDYYAPFTQYVAFLAGAAVVAARSANPDAEAHAEPHEPSLTAPATSAG